MKINKIRISNILGISHLEFEPGKQITEISGKNGSGKTSIIEAIRNSLKGGTDATLLRKGAKEGEIVLVLDDGLQIQKSVSESKSELNLFDVSGKKINKPQNYLNQLFDLLSVNPVSFLTADKKNRVTYLLEALPFELPADKLAAVLSELGEHDINLNYQGHPLEVLGNIHEAVYSERRDINRSVKEKQSAVSQLKESMVPLDFSPKELENQISLQEEKSQRWREQKEQYISQISTNCQNQLDALNDSYAKAKAEILENAENKKKEVLTKFELQFNPLNENLIRLREQQKQIGAVQKTQELINQYDSESDALNKYSEKLTGTLSKLEELKGNLLATLPIKGLEIKDGEIFCDGIPFDRLNTAKQVQLAVEVAKLRAGNLGIICLDGLERLDQEQYAAFKAESEKCGLQLIITKVSDDELTIN